MVVVTLVVAFAVAAGSMFPNARFSVEAPVIWQLLLDSTTADTARLPVPAPAAAALAQHTDRARGGIQVRMVRRAWPLRDTGRRGRRRGRVPALRQCGGPRGWSRQGA